MYKNWTAGDGEVLESHEDATTGGTEEAEDIEGVEKVQTRVTYNIVFVTSEAAPYSKTGGLGDVCGSLPIVLAARGHRVMVVSPRYLHGSPADKNFAGASELDCHIKVYCFGGEQEVAFFHEYREGVDWVRIFSSFSIVNLWTILYLCINMQKSFFKNYVKQEKLHFVKFFLFALIQF